MSDKKLHILYRLEPGCMGPNGAKTIEAFCQSAERGVQSLDAQFVHWEILPRFDKSLAEMEYRVKSKKISQIQAARYLQVFGKDLDQFEQHLHEKIGELIESYLNR